MNERSRLLIFSYFSPPCLIISCKISYSLLFLCNWFYTFCTIFSFNPYSRVHKSSDSFFSKILEEPSIVQKKLIPHINGLHFSMRSSKKKFKMAEIQNGRLKKKTHFLALPIFNIFSWKFHGFVFGFVELIDAKSIGMT